MTTAFACGSPPVLPGPPGIGVPPALPTAREVAEALLATYAELRRHLTHRLRSADDAADIAQSSFLQAYAHALAGPVANPRALLYQTARHLCIDRFRRRGLEAAVLDAWFGRVELDAPSAERIVSARQQLRRLVERIEAMPPLRREVFVRVRVHGQSHREVGEALRLTAAAVEKHMARAVDDLSALALAFAAEAGF